MDINKIIAEMPRVNVPSGVGLCMRYRDAQCQLLAEAGYRPVPSEEEFQKKIILLMTEWENDYIDEEEIALSDFLSENIRDWLLGDNKEVL